MRKFWRTFGVLLLGIYLLAGCGDQQEGAVSGIQPVEMEGIGAEGYGQGQGGQGQDGPAPNGPTPNGSAQSGQLQSGPAQNGQPQSGERITLTLGSVGNVGSGSGLRAAVEAYNAQSEKYCIEIVDYLPEVYDNAVAEASRDRFRMDLATGKGTDIIDFGDLVADEAGYAGAVLDLNTFLAPEEKQEKYLGNILECAQTGGALYEISPAFTLDFIAGDGSRLGMENGWTLEEMVESFERNGRDGSALARGGVRTAARLVEHSIEDFVDWDRGTADFCREEFYRVLEFGREADSGQFIRDSRESVASGTHLASCSGLNTVAGIQYLKWLYGDNVAVKGWPCSRGTGVAVDIGQSSLGISAYSRCPEGAWDFLEFYVEAGWTNRKVYIGSPEGLDIADEAAWVERDFSSEFAGFPVNRALFEEMLEQSMVQRYYPEGDFAESGKPYPLYQWDEYGVPDFYANTAEDVERLREVIALADRRSLSGMSAISQIIQEEISGYNAGILTPEQTAAKIQNRVQLYLDEQRR